MSFGSKVSRDPVTGNPQLVFISRRLPVANVELVGKAKPCHVKLMLDTGKFRWPALYWNAADKIDGIETGGEVDVVFRLSKSTFQDQDQLQLTPPRCQRSQ